MRYKRLSIVRITIQSLVNNAADDSPTIGIHEPTLADPSSGDKAAALREKRRNMLHDRLVME